MLDRLVDRDREKEKRKKKPCICKQRNEWDFHLVSVSVCQFQYERTNCKNLHKGKQPPFLSFLSLSLTVLVFPCFPFRLLLQWTLKQQLLLPRVTRRDTGKERGAETNACPAVSSSLPCSRYMAILQQGVDLSAQKERQEGMRRYCPLTTFSPSKNKVVFFYITSHPASHR